MMSIIEKVCLALITVGVFFVVVKMLGYAYDGELLFECHQMQNRYEQGINVKPPEYCYKDLGMERR